MGMARHLLLRKALKYVDTLSPWEKGNVEPNISDVFRLYFLIIIRREEGNSFWPSVF